VSTLVIVGLGPGRRRYLTEAALTALRRARTVYLWHARDRLLDPPPGVTFESFDDIDETALGPEEAATLVVSRLLSLVQPGRRLVFAVPGHPLLGQPVVPLLQARAAEAGVAVEIIPGLSPLDLVLPFLQPPPLQTPWQVVPASWAAGWPLADVFTAGRPWDPTRPVLLTDLRQPGDLEALRPRLAALYPPDHPVRLIALSPDGPQVHDRTVATLTPDLPLPAYLAGRPLDPLDDRRSLEAVWRLVAWLRGPAGCPWDRQQTNQSLKMPLLEEAAEAVEALDQGDWPAVAEELGDLLLLVLMHSQIAAEAGRFRVEDVCATLTTKLIRRHPHVFGDRPLPDAETVLRTWEAIKRAERGPTASALGEIPAALPALLAAQTLVRRALRAGLPAPAREWLLTVVSQGLAALPTEPQPERRRALLGRLLLAIAALARLADLEAEEALRATVREAAAAFRQLEERLRAAGRELAALSPQEGAAWWRALLESPPAPEAGPSGSR